VMHTSGHLSAVHDNVSNQYVYCLEAVRPTVSNCCLTSSVSMCITDQIRLVSNLEAVLGTEAFSTRFTMIWTVSGMFAHVCHQTVSGIESTRTQCASMWSSSSVFHHVLLEV